MCVCGTELSSHCGTALYDCDVVPDPDPDPSPDPAFMRGSGLEKATDGAGDGGLYVLRFMKYEAGNEGPAAF